MTLVVNEIQKDIQGLKKLVSTSNNEYLKSIVSQFEKGSRLSLDAYMRIGQMCLIKGFYRGGVYAFKKAESVGNNYPLATKCLGDIYLKEGRFKLASESYLIAEENSINGKYPDATLKRANIALEQQLWEEALVLFDKVQEDSEEFNSRAIYQKGKTLEKIKRFDEAIEAFQMGIELSGNTYFKGYACIGRILVKKGKLREAEIQFALAANTQSDSDKIKYLIEQGEVLKELKRYEKAIKVFKHCLTFSSANKNDRQYLYSQITSCYDSLGLVDESLKWGDRSILHYESLHSFDELGHLRKGLVLMQVEEYDDAILEFEQVLQRYPEGISKELCYLGEIYLFKKDNEVKGLEYYQKALESKSRETQSKAYFSIANYYYTKGHFSDALGYYEQAEECGDEPSMPISYNKALCLKHLGDLVAAKLCLEEILSLGLHSEDTLLVDIYEQLSEICGDLNDREKESQYIYQALELDNRRISVVSRIFEKHSSPKTLDFYKSRLEYLDLIIQKVSLRGQVSIPRNTKSAWRVSSLDYANSTNNLLIEILLLKSIQLSVNISFQERIKAAYLIAFVQGQFALAFHIIDTILDLEFELDELDLLFYLHSAVRIGEPYKELASIVGVELSKGGDNSSFNLLCSHILQCKEQNLLLDPYLPNISLNDQIFFDDLIDNLELHPIVNHLLISIKNANCDLNLPFTKSEVFGYLGQIHTGLEQNLNLPKVALEDDWVVFELLLKQEELKHELLINKIRALIKSKTPYLLVLNRLMREFMLREDEAIRKELSILQAVAMLSNYFDLKRKNLAPGSNEEAATICIADLVSNEIIGEVINLGILTTFGLSFSVGYLAGKTISRIHQKWQVEKVEEIFQDILIELEL